VFIVFVAVLSVSMCDDLHITVDNTLAEVCINGMRYPQTPNYKTVKYFDQIPLPGDWNSDGDGCIAVLGTNNKPLTAAGILACVTSNVNPTALFWRCAPRHKVHGCCKSCSRAFWKNPATTNMLEYLPNKHHNKDFVDKLPDQCKAVNGDLQWHWDNLRKQPNVCCIMKGNNTNNNNNRIIKVNCFISLFLTLGIYTTD